MNPLTRGYEDITVVSNKQSKLEDCIKTLKDIKVKKAVLKKVTIVIPSPPTLII